MRHCKVVYLGNKNQSVRLEGNGQTMVTENDASRLLPSDMLALALADCAETVLALVLEQKHLDFSGSYVDVSKDADFENYKVKAIHLTFHLHKEYSEETRKEIPHILETMCVVGRSLHPDVVKDYKFLFDVK
ncbi:OsmC family protein [Dialister sp.]|jgi:putative redox protein|uniref:OsmC family protein n=1 Tax=Dialister sp. TaxID=1955814 RepID=UPI0025D7CA36|nr:OsmC family protein [Dialister sp.]